MKNIWQKFLNAGTAIALSLGISWPVEAAAFTGLYVFGDSLSDAGNVYNLTGYPTPPFEQGRFADGPIWVEILANQLQLQPVLLTEVGLRNAPTDGVNFAFGGATTGEANIENPRLLGVQEQLAAFTEITPRADANALYIIWAGGNDYLGAVLEQQPPPDPSQSVENLVAGIRQLEAQGARNFLVLNLPDLGRTPLALQLGYEVSRDLTQITQAHNTALMTTLEQLRQQSPEINLIHLDTFQLIRTLGPQAFDHTLVACLPTLVEPGREITVIPCQNPDQYLFWDPVHPTSAAHQLVAAAALEQLTPLLNSPQVDASMPATISVLD